MSTITKYRTQNPTTSIIHCIHQQKYFILKYQVSNCKYSYYLYRIQRIYIVFQLVINRFAEPDAFGSQISIELFCVHVTIHSVDNGTFNNLFKNVNIYTIYRTHNFIFTAAIYMFDFVYINRIRKKGLQIQAWRDPKGFRRLRLPEFIDDRHKTCKIFSLMHWPHYAPRDTSNTLYVRSESTPGPKDPMGNRTSDLPVCSALLAVY